MVTARRASTGVSRSLRANHLAAARLPGHGAPDQRTGCSGGTTGASLCRLNRIPRRCAERAGLMRDARSRPRTDADVPVAPVEAVRGEKRRQDAVRPHTIELILADGLGVNHHRPAIVTLAPVPPLGARHRLDHLLRGGVAVGVRQQLDAVWRSSPPPSGRPRRPRTGGCRCKTPAPRQREQVRLGQPGALPLRQSVEHQLEPADPEPAAVAPRERRPVGAQASVSWYSGYETRSIGSVPFSAAAQASPSRRRRWPVLCGRDPEAGVIRARPSQQVGMAVLGIAGKHVNLTCAHAASCKRPVGSREPGRRTIHLSTCRPPVDRRGGGDTRLIERHAVADRHVPRGMHHPDRKLGGDAVEILLRRVAPLVEHRIVVARAEDVFVLGRQPAQPAAQRPDDVLDRRDVACRRRREIDPVEPLATCVKWPWPSTKPGINVRPPRSTTWAERPAAANTPSRSPTARMRPPRTATAWASGCRSSIVTTSAFANTAVGSWARPGMSSRNLGPARDRAPAPPAELRARAHSRWPQRGWTELQVALRAARERLVVR